MRWNFAFVALLALILFSCEEEKIAELKETKSFQDFKANHYQFILSDKATFRGIKFKLPATFDKTWRQSVTITSNSLIRYSKVFKMFFTVEEFSEQDTYLPFVARVPMILDLKNRFHDAYVDQRLKTLDEKGLSIKKAGPKDVHFPMIIQTVRGVDIDWYDEDLLYVVATLEVKHKYYVFQWIGSEEKMKFMYDDFIAILKSVQSL